MNRSGKAIRAWIVLTLAMVGTIACSQDSTKIARDKIRSNMAVKVAPLGVVASQLHGYTSEARLFVEYKFRPKHSIQFALGPVFPNPVYGAYAMDQGGDPYMFYGGHFITAYRYYFTDREVKPFGWYLGVEASLNGMGSQMRREQYDIYVVSWYAESHAHAIINSYSITGGFQVKIRRGTHFEVFDVSGSFGYAYYYMWRSYDGFNLEYFKREQYGFYKKVPLHGSINLLIGGLVFREKRSYSGATVW